MTINKKFKIGESAYLLLGNVIKEVKVGLIRIMIEGDEEHINICYRVSVPNRKNSWVAGKGLFKTNKEAIQELIKQMGYEISVNDLKEI